MFADLLPKLGWCGVLQILSVVDGAWVGAVQVGNPRVLFVAGWVWSRLGFPPARTPKIQRRPPPWLAAGGLGRFRAPAAPSQRILPKPTQRTPKDPASPAPSPHPQGGSHARAGCPPTPREGGSHAASRALSISQTKASQGMRVGAVLGRLGGAAFGCCHIERGGEGGTSLSGHPHHPPLSITLPPLG